MNTQEEERFVQTAKAYVMKNFALSELSNEALEAKVEELVEYMLADQYCTIEQRVSIVKQVYSSIRGFGLLDSIMVDDSIPEFI